MAFGNVTEVAASASLYKHDCATIEDAILRGKIYAASIGEEFSGMSLDILEDGTVEIHIAGLDTVRL